MRVAQDTDDKNQVLAFGQQSGTRPQRRPGAQDQDQEVKIQRGKSSESGDILDFAKKLRPRQK